ncbi:MAG: DUF938 domain-containing protein [Kiloniellaceae bacterium]
MANESPRGLFPAQHDSAGDGRLHAPATHRNQQPIGDALADWLPQTGCVLELASGTGEHALHFAARFPQLVWQPSDPDPAHRRSIAAYRHAEGSDNLRPPLDIDVTISVWPVAEPVAAMVCCNMIHIAPWAAATGLIAGAGHHIMPGGGLFLYGPFKRHGAHTAPSNADFDADLRARNPSWGLRDLEEVAGLAAAAGLGPPQIRELPANNLALWFAKPVETS